MVRNKELGDDLHEACIHKSAVFTLFKIFDKKLILQMVYLYSLTFIWYKGCTQDTYILLCEK